MDQHTEVDAEIPIARRIGKIIAIKGERCKGEIIDHCHLSDEFGSIEPSAIQS